MAEEMAVIQGIHIGCRDVGTPVLWFGVKFLGGGSLQILGWDDAFTLLKESRVSDFTSLDGKPCVVDVDKGVVTFKRLLT